MLAHSQIRPTFIDRHGLRLAILADCLFELAAGNRLVVMNPQQKIHRVARLVRKRPTATV